MSINLKNNEENIFFTSDTHFYHQNIIEYQGRPFADAGEMNQALIDGWNSVCDKNSVVYFLGDFLLGGEIGYKLVPGILEKLNFKHIHFIKGNHDNAFVRWYRDVLPYNITIYGSYLETKINQKNIVISHYPVLSWNKKNRGAWMLCGHCHYNLTAIRKDSNSIGKILDIGVDGNNFVPYSFKDIERIMEKKSIQGELDMLNDHHN